MRGKIRSLWLEQTEKQLHVWGHGRRLPLFRISLQVPIDWEPVDVTPVKGPDGKNRIPQKAIDSVNRHKIGLKGPLATPIGKGHQSLNLALRKWVVLQDWRSYFIWIIVEDWVLYSVLLKRTQGCKLESIGPTICLNITKAIKHVVVFLDFTCLICLSTNQTTLSIYQLNKSNQSNFV